MDLQVMFRKTESSSDLEQWRERYLNSLVHSQELFIEVMVHGGDAHWIYDGEQRCGYVIAQNSAVILEFYLEPSHWVFGQTILRQFVLHAGIKRALIKSFDTLFFSSAIDEHTRVSTMGLLSRDYIRRELPKTPDTQLHLRQATLGDLERVRAVDQRVFTRPERLRQVIQEGHMSLFEQAGVLVGFGIIRPVIPGRPAVDLGIAIDSPHRLRGFGVYMLQQMMDYSVSQGWLPVAGCALENVASRSMAERAGLVARHRLPEVTF